MFGDGPHLFGLPPGVDFPLAVVAGLDARLDDPAPDSLARVTIFANAPRMQRRLREVYDGGPPRLLPRIRLVTDLAFDPGPDMLPPPVAPLRRRLELAQLVSALLDSAPDLAPRAALYDLADSLAALLDEMQGEGVPPEVIAALDVTDQSGHWERTLSFLRIVQRYFGGEDPPDAEARLRSVVQGLARRWADVPPEDPVLVVGSTGSRGATLLLMEAVARLPRGAVILPGVDFDLPEPAWSAMGDPPGGEDHPQFRFRRLATRLGLSPLDIRPWTAAEPASPARNRLVSLSLRPAPVTDQWLAEGPALGDLAPACANLTLLEAPGPREEAEAIALRLRAAVDEGRTAALVTPDRMLTRQVAAALDRWDIVPDDSAGLPLHLSPPGRFLRMVADLFGRTLTAEALLTLLKHPLAASGEERGDHLRRTHELELSIRRKGPPFPDGAMLRRWADATATGDPGRLGWADWLASLIEGCDRIGPLPLAEFLSRHVALAEALSAGPVRTGSGTLWDEAAGRAAAAVLADLRSEADAGGIYAPFDYAALVLALLTRGEVRDRDRGHPLVLFRGTQEARVGGADLVILGGLNEGVWPAAPDPDPWLNRALRARAGLRVPERQIGLSAHDYMLAIAAPEVWLTRSVRSNDAETVPSRWLNRLVNLIGGLPDQGGPRELAAIRDRGQDWLAQSQSLSRPDRPVDPARRPSPRPPLAARPRRLSVTEIGTLIRDPYTIYARKVLGLEPLDPLTATADAAARGTILHRIVELFVRDGPPPDAPDAREGLMSRAADILAEDCPWPTIRALWLARIDRIADGFLADETARRERGRPTFFEARGEVVLDGVDVRLVGKADRIDVTPEGSALIYDYKTGKPPTKSQQLTFEKQLLIEAAMLERGAWGEDAPRQAAGAAYIGLGSTPGEVAAPLDSLSPSQVWEDLGRLLAAWNNPDRGYTARMFPERISYPGDFDHLARRGEWDDTDPAVPEDLE